MVDEHLSAIRSREEDARRRILEAETEVAAILDAAREDGERRLERVRAEAAEHEKALLAEARKHAEETIAAMRADNERAIAALRTAAAKNEERALEIIDDSFRNDA